MRKEYREQLKVRFCLGTFCLLYYYIYIRYTNIFLHSYCTHFFCCHSSNYCLNRSFFWSYILNFSIPSSHAKRLFKINKILFSFVSWRKEQGMNSLCLWEISETYFVQKTVLSEQLLFDKYVWNDCFKILFLIMKECENIFFLYPTQKHFWWITIPR